MSTHLDFSQIANADQPPPQLSRRVAIYARVSTKDKGQDVENQLDQLRSYCARMGYDVSREYIDHASGKRSDRDQFQALFADAGRKLFDLVLFWSLDRFSREGVLETLQHLQKLGAAQVDWKSYTEQYLDSCGLFRDAVLAILATIAKQERIRISERTMAGLAKARSRGTKSGNPIGHPRAIFDRQKLLDMRTAGASLSQIADKLKISRTTAARVIKAR